MDRRYHARSLMDFLGQLSTEEVCEEYLMQMRWPNGMPCLQCSYKEFYPRLKHRRAYKCKSCGFFNRPTAGTIFHKTRTSLHKWFVALFLIANDKRGISALTLSKHLDLSYQTAWAILHRVRHAMAKRNDQYQLIGYVEMDEMFIGAPTEGEKRGRDTKQTPVLVAVSFVPAEDGKEYMGFAKLHALKNVTSDAIIRFAAKHIKTGTVIRSDGLPVYPALERHGFVHDRHSVKKRKAHLVLPHVHTFISNLRSFVMGTHHGLDEIHLQQYLDEYCYRFNRRKHENELFDRLLLACLEKEETPFCALVG